MSATATDPRSSGTRAKPKRTIRLSWSDPVFRNIVWQILIVGFVAALVYYLVSNTNRNLADRHIATGFAFLSRNASIGIGESLIPYDSATSTFAQALLVGLVNTIRVSVIGIVLATVLGTVIGIGRLSKNWLISRLAQLYVEVLRDIPVLLQLLFWYALLQSLPGARQAFHFGGVFLSQRGLKFPLLVWDAAYGWAFAAFLVGLLGTIAWNRSAKRRQEEYGIKPRVWPVALALLIGLPVIAWAALGAPLVVDAPALRGFNFLGGGTMTPEFTALLLGLVIYSASYIAEIVRSGIQAIPQGQWEAAGALGLRPGSVLRLVVLPQSMRVIIPPMTSQYLNLAKNSSLAIAIGYPDIVAIANTTLNQTGQAIEGIGIIMAVYLSISVSISLFMNWYNARIALVER